MLRFPAPPNPALPRPEGGIWSGADLVLLLASTADSPGRGIAPSVIENRVLLLYQWQPIRRVLA